MVSVLTRSYPAVAVLMKFDRYLYFSLFQQPAPGSEWDAGGPVNLVVAALEDVDVWIEGDAEPTQLPLPFPGSLGGRRPVLVPCAGWREELAAASAGAL